MVSDVIGETTVLDTVMENEGNYGEKETLKVLEKIQDLIKVVPDDVLIIYKIKDFFKQHEKQTMQVLKQDEILDDLEKWGALKIYKTEIADNNNIYYLKILPKFKDIYLDHLNNQGTKFKLPKQEIVLVSEGITLYELKNPENKLKLNKNKLPYRIIKKLKKIHENPLEEVLIRTIPGFSPSKFKSMQELWGRKFLCHTNSIKAVIYTENGYVKSSRQLIFK